MDDDELVRVLGESLAGDLTVSTRAVGAARAAYDWMQVDAELADLVFDSADQPELAGVRGGAEDVRQLTYQAAGLTIECELSVDGIVGEVLPPGPARVRLQAPGSAERELAVDERGRFVDDEPPAGPFSLRLARPGEPEVTTPWALP
jgi:hypothetical protein